MCQEWCVAGAHDVRQRRLGEPLVFGNQQFRRQGPQRSQPFFGVANRLDSHVLPHCVQYRLRSRLQWELGVVLLQRHETQWRGLRQHLELGTALAVDQEEQDRLAGRVLGDTVAVAGEMHHSRLGFALDDLQQFGLCYWTPDLAVLRDNDRLWFHDLGSGHHIGLKRQLAQAHLADDHVRYGRHGHPER